MSATDAVIIGGGHNGLVAAAYLAKAGLRVTVVERRPIVGGACVTEEIHPGFRVSTLAYTCGLFRPEVKASLATSAVAGTMAGPRTAGTAFVLGHHTLGDINGVKGAWGWARGGMGAISDAVAAAALHFGARIRTGAEVRRVVVRDGHA